ncbi:MAG TPA: DUF6252 family protein [Chitinophagaceae bacterium]|jgi:hypothetical protein|nr:DUF6252 family protein [Chitinophagaceae bacterium]
MKTRSFLLFLLIISAFSCGKDDPVVDLPFLNAKADGVVKDCNVVSVTLVGSSLQINGQTTAGDVLFILNINNYTSGQIGTFNIGPGNFTTALYREGTISYSAGTSSGTGRIQITNSNSVGIQGNFEFTGLSTTGASKQITEGRFSAYY